MPPNIPVKGQPSAALTEIADRLLAMCDNNPVTPKLASQILSSWFAVPISRVRVTQLAAQLARLRLIKWQYSIGSKKYIKHNLSTSHRGNAKVVFFASSNGRAFLEQTRNAP